MESQIIHVDMDCFYAAIEARDNPSLRQEPIAVGGQSSRGVLTTCNYEARKFGIHSAMPNFIAVRKCPHLIILPIRFEIYRFESKRIRSILNQYSDLIEPLSLDEAYIDVSKSKRNAVSIADDIRRQIRRVTGLTASAGVAPNKMLAKIASDWKKPNGLFHIAKSDISKFMSDLPVSKIWGIGKKAEDKLLTKGIRTCGDLQSYSSLELTHMFGKFGGDLYDLCRGIDHRPVVSNRIRKSISVERTFTSNLESLEACSEKVQSLFRELEDDLFRIKVDRKIAKLFIKLKFSDFSKTTVERIGLAINESSAQVLLKEAFGRKALPVRLIGLGVRLATNHVSKSSQLEFEFQDNLARLALRG